MEGEREGKRGRERFVPSTMSHLGPVDVCQRLDWLTHCASCLVAARNVSGHVAVATVHSLFLLRHKIHAMLITKALAICTEE